MEKFLGIFSERFWELLMALANAGLAFAIVFRSPQIMHSWNERRRIRAEERASDWTRLREENARLHMLLGLRDESIVDLRKEIEQINDGRLEWKERAIFAETVLQGRGTVRQAASEAVAEIRLGDVDGKRRLDGDVDD